MLISPKKFAQETEQQQHTLQRKAKIVDLERQNARVPAERDIRSTRSSPKKQGKVRLEKKTVFRGLAVHSLEKEESIYQTSTKKE